MMRDQWSQCPPLMPHLFLRAFHYNSGLLKSGLRPELRLLVFQPPCWYSSRSCRHGGSVFTPVDVLPVDSPPVTGHPGDAPPVDGSPWTFLRWTLHRGRSSVDAPPMAHRRPRGVASGRLSYICFLQCLCFHLCVSHHCVNFDFKQFLSAKFIYSCDS